MTEFVNNDDNITYYSKIFDLAFYVLSTEEIVKDSNVDITNKEIMRGEKPAEGGIYDQRMGTTDTTWLCHTCYNPKSSGKPKMGCPGHFGSLQLKYPVKSPMFRDELLKWLKVVCFHCGNLIAKPNANILNPDKRLSELVKSIKTINTCSHCSNQHMQVIKDANKTFVFWRIKEDNKKIIYREEFFNHQIKNTLEKISDETVLLLGKPINCHPKNFILQTIPVPPNTIRPDIRKIGGSRSSNSDTTSLLKSIFEINHALPDQIPEIDQITSVMKDGYSNLDLAYHTMVKGGGGGNVKLITNTSKPPIAIAERFPKKVGRIRRNLMGKRVEYMIRSVITGDPRLKINEVGVPMIHARDLEIPEKVTGRNIERLKSYFNNGTEIYPGCKHIIKGTDNQKYKRKYLDNYQLQIGDTVMRDMITGDYLCFNRQPSLLFSNIAGMRVIVMETGDTLRINPSVCNYFNADFDGDQMNSIVAQNIMARNECMSVSKVSRWLISPQKHAPLVGAFQDGLIGIFELTKSGIKFNKWHAMQMFGDIHTKGLNYDFPENIYDNRNLVSRLLPEINISNKTPSFYKSQYASFIKYNPEDINVVIEQGKLLKGVLDKATSGQDQSGSIIHIIANEYGNDTALEVVYNLQQIVHRFFTYHGFTTGIEDINISEQTTSEVKKNLATMILNSRKITHRLNNGKLIAPLGMKLQEFYESEQLNSLSSGDDFAIPILSDINLNTNQLARLILSGSKGKLTNFIAINGAIGVQTINGRRFGYQAGWGRTSPYFVRYDTEPDANGFISMSFREGIRNDVFPFMAGETRHGLISNALSTSITGYQNRISVKNLESIMIDNLRKSAKGMNVIQPLFAECGFDPSKLEKVKFPTILISDEELEKKYKLKVEILDKKFQTEEVKKMINEEFEQLKKDREYYRKCHLALEAHNPREYIMDNSKLMPINVYRIVEDVIFNYRDIYSDLPEDKKTFNPIYIINAVKDFCENLPYVYMNDLQRQLKRPVPKHILVATNMIAVLIRSYLCTSYLFNKKICNETLNFVLEKISLTYKKSLIDYGTSAGIIAAQCVCEQFTQYVLDSKHRTGGQGGTKTNAIVRIQEILGAKDTETMKQPQMLIMVKKEYETDKLKVQEISNHIEMMTFGRFVSNMRIFFESYSNPVHPDFINEKKIFTDFEKYNYGIKIPSDLAKWCIRYTLNKEEMILKSMKLETIVYGIYKDHPEVFIVHTNENDNDLILRIYLRTSMIKPSNDYYNDVVLYTANELKKVVVRGIRNIIGSIVVDVLKNEVKPDGSIDKTKTYAILSAGTNMKDIISNQYIDPYRTQSDSIEEIQRIFGVNAARNKIINEMIIALEGLSRIHCSVFADEMCYAGVVSNIQKTGLQKRENANVTLRISFQTVIQVIQNSAIHGLTDRIGGVSGPLIMGTNPNIGTTFNQVVVNEDFIKENMANAADIIENL